MSSTQLQETGGFDVEYVADVRNPSPVCFSGEDPVFYREIGGEFKEADVVVVRDRESFPEDILEETHYRLEGRYREVDVYIGRGVPSGFPGLNPVEIEKSAEEGIDSLCDAYLENG